MLSLIFPLFTWIVNPQLYISNDATEGPSKYKNKPLKQDLKGLPFKKKIEQICWLKIY